MQFCQLDWYIEYLDGRRVFKVSIRHMDNCYSIIDILIVDSPYFVSNLFKVALYIQKMKHNLLPSEMCFNAT